MDEMVSKKESIAEETVNYLMAVSARAEKAVELLGAKLAIVMTEAETNMLDDKKGRDREYPPLFSEIRAQIVLIEHAVRQLEDYVRRTAL